MDPKTQLLTNDPLTRKRWARDLYKILPQAIEFNELIGSDKTAVVQQSLDLGKGEGDQMTFGIRLPLTGEGVVGDDTLEGNEEKMSFRNFKAGIEELNHAVDTGGKMEEQRIPYDLMMEAKDGLQEWWGNKLSDYMFAVLCGDTSFKINGKTFADAPTAASTNRVLRVNDVADDASMTSADVIDLGFLDRMKQKAELPVGTAKYRIRPIMIGGKKYYRIILHNYCFDQLRTNMNAGQLGDILRNAQKLNIANVEYEYNGLLISKSERVRKSLTGTNIYNNLLLGSQAAVCGWGGAGDSKSTAMVFKPYTRDAERYVMVRGGGILGIKKVIFDDVDYGVMVGAGYGVAL